MSATYGYGPEDAAALAPMIAALNNPTPCPDCGKSLHTWDDGRTTHRTASEGVACGMAKIAAAAASRTLTADLEVVTAKGSPVLRDWRQLPEYVDTKLVGTDPTGAAWVIERVSGMEGPTVWLAWTLAAYVGEDNAEPSPHFRLSDAIDYVSDQAGR